MNAGSGSGIIRLASENLLRSSSYGASAKREKVAPKRSDGGFCCFVEEQILKQFVLVHSVSTGLYQGPLCLISWSAQTQAPSGVVMW